MSGVVSVLVPKAFQIQRHLYGFCGVATHLGLDSKGSIFLRV